MAGANGGLEGQKRRAAVPAWARHAQRPLRDEPAPIEEMTVTWNTVGSAAATARTRGVRTQWAVAPTAGVLRLTW